MAPIVDFSVFQGLDKDNENLVTIEASVVTGFEDCAQEEVKERFGLKEVAKYQGRVIFDLRPSMAKDVLGLRTIDNASVIFGTFSKFDFSESMEDGLKKLAESIEKLQWEKGLQTWQNVSGFEGDLKLNSRESDIHQDKKLKSDITPKFRCTCYRTGSNHKFSSMEAARDIGGAIQDKFKWDVKMKDFDIEVVVNIDDDQVYYGLKLTKESLYRRNIEHFGPTTLRATICASLLRRAKIQPGDIVVDPMCGGGSIPIEGALSGMNAYMIGGDIHEKASTRSRNNAKSLEESSNLSQKMDFLQWDVTKLPIRGGFVDVFVTDLPFGKRSGSKADNRVLYPNVMVAMARVVRPKTGRAVILTQDKTSMFKSALKYKKYWKTNRHAFANIGGLSALVFEMTRTDAIPPP